MEVVVERGSGSWGKMGWWRGKGERGGDGMVVQLGRVGDEKRGGGRGEGKLRKRRRAGGEVSERNTN